MHRTPVLDYAARMILQHSSCEKCLQALYRHWQRLNTDRVWQKYHTETSAQRRSVHWDLRVRWSLFSWSLADLSKEQFIWLNAVQNVQRGFRFTNIRAFPRCFAHGREQLSCDLSFLDVALSFALCVHNSLTVTFRWKVNHINIPQHAIILWLYRCKVTQQLVIPYLPMAIPSVTCFHDCMKSLL